MLIYGAAFSQRGLELARRLVEGLSQDGNEVDLATTRRLVAKTGSTDVRTMGGLAAWADDAFVRADALLFVCACGIAIRAIAPHVRDKFRDPAVVCVDEAGGYAIPLLSGHVGGANDLARRVASLCGARAVITTATDVNGVFAVDEWARQNDLAIVERDLAMEVSVALLEGRPVGFSSEVATEGTLPCGLVEGGKALSCELGISVSRGPDVRPFSRTLHLVPRVVTVGVGCKRGTPSSTVLSAVDACLMRAHVAPQAVRTLASIDVKADEKGLHEAARAHGWKLRFHTAEELAAVPGEFNSSEFVLRTVGVDNVCERAACACGERLLLGRVASDGVTVAVSVEAQGPLTFSSSDAQGGEAGENTSFASRPNTVHNARLVTCVGIGPGGAKDMTLRAREELQNAQVIVGYTTYVDLVRDGYPQAEFVTTPMRKEAERCRIALERASAGQRVAVVCSGDPGVYGMAGLLHELAPAYPGVSVEVVPGVTAATGGAALLGAPLMTDWCCVSLSDLMTPWDEIEARLRAASQADFCICLYNPGSRGRADHLRRACDVLLEYASPSTVCGVVRNIGRTDESSRILTLAELRNTHVDMLTCVFIGNSQTCAIDGHMVTPRGYDVRRGEVDQKGVSPSVQGVAPSVHGHARPHVLVFGGTTEGRELVEWLDARGTCHVVACVATEYGAELLREGARVEVVRGPLSPDDKRRLVSEHDFLCVVDATHPYAQHISASVDELARRTGLDVVRVQRDSVEMAYKNWTSAKDASEAAQIVAKRKGRVLLTTGTRDLATFVHAMPDYAERLYVRVLPINASLDRVKELGIAASHVIAMQGPFSAALNAALIRELGIACMVTKQSGATGGFDQKVRAAKECGIELVVIERPSTQAGASLATAKRTLEERYGL